MNNVKTCSSSLIQFSHFVALFDRFVKKNSITESRSIVNTKKCVAQQNVLCTFYLRHLPYFTEQKWQLE